MEEFEEKGNENIPVKTEMIEFKTENLEDENATTSVLFDENNVQTIVLQNLQYRDENNIPMILNEFDNTNSDGNLHVESIRDGSNVIQTYIIEEPQYGRFENGLIFEDSDADSTVHYVIEEAKEYVQITKEYQEKSCDIPEIIEEELVDNDNIEYVYDDSSSQCPEEEEEEGEYTEVEDYEFTDDTVEIDRHEEGVEEIDKDVENKSPSPVMEIDTLPQTICLKCNKSFKSAGGLKRHMTVSHENNEDSADEDDPLAFQLCLCCGEPSDSAHTTGDFKCDECSRQFLQKNFLERHVCLEHPKDSTYICYECKKLFDSRDKLVEHMKIHPVKMIKCEGCGREFTRKYHLERHICQTGCTGLPRKAYDCRVCKKFFTRKDNLAEHLRAHAGQAKKKKKYTCKYCNKEFQGTTLMNIHVRTHTGERPFMCDICPKKFPSSASMKKHRRMHTGEKPYSCEICGRRFAAKETLNRHWRTHTGEKPHVCQFCGKAFIQPSQLRAHIFHHTGENAYKCPHCNRAFNRKLRLTTHIKFIHEGADPLPCPQCDKTFFRKEDVNRHMMCHTGERPYSCDVCHKSFSVKSSLKAHLLTHGKEEPCTCETCGRSFIRRDCLMRHIRARHRDLLEDIVANAEKRRLQKQLLNAATSAAAKSTLTTNTVWSELTLTEYMKELLTLLVDEDCLYEFGYPETPVDKVLDSVIRKCGHKPASEEDFDYLGRIRENAKLLFTVVIDDVAVKELLNNQTVEEVITHVLRLAKSQKKEAEDENDNDEDS